MGSLVEMAKSKSAAWESGGLQAAELSAKLSGDLVEPGTRP